MVTPNVRVRIPITLPKICPSHVVVSRAKISVLAGTAIKKADFLGLSRDAQNVCAVVYKVNLKVTIVILLVCTYYNNRYQIFAEYRAHARAMYDLARSMSHTIDMFCRIPTIHMINFSVLIPFLLFSKHRSTCL